MLLVQYKCRVVGNLHSKDEWVRLEGMTALRRLAARWADAAAARALLDHTFAVYSGAGGKLTSSEAKIAVLNVTALTLCIMHCSVFLNHLHTVLPPN